MSETRPVVEFVFDGQLKSDVHAPVVQGETVDVAQGTQAPSQIAQNKSAQHQDVQNQDVQNKDAQNSEITNTKTANKTAPDQEATSTAAHSEQVQDEKLQNKQIKDSQAHSEPSATAPAFSRFEDLPLSKQVMRAVQAMGFSALTPIQAQILPHTLANQDAIGQAQTGTGKTATFLITIIEALLKNPFKKDEVRYLAEPRALILAPTRELAQQIFEDCRKLTQFTDTYSLCITGGADFDKQAKQLARRPLDILIGTPGRIIDWVQKGVLFLDRVEVFVLDEADRMLDMGFIPDIKRIVRHLPANTHRQSLLFSATFNTDVMNLAYRWLYSPVFVEIAKAQKTNADIEQRFYLLSDDKKMTALKQLLRDEAVKKCIIFANRKDQVKRLHDHLAKRMDIVMLSGDVVQQKRERHLQKFKDGEVNLLVATDVAGRGIHVDDVTHVINFTLPDMPDDYVHRIGRTGRAGQTGISISFVSEDDAFNLPALEKHLGVRFELHQFEFAPSQHKPDPSAIQGADKQHSAVTDVNQSSEAPTATPVESTELPHAG